jgi:hypothetical protein
VSEKKPDRGTPSTPHTPPEQTRSHPGEGAYVARHSDQTRKPDKPEGPDQPAPTPAPRVYSPPVVKPTMESYHPK